MRNNPLIPYILIMVLGLGVIFFLSLDGAGNKEEIAAGDEETAESTDGGGEELVASCTACHGGDLTGQIGPDLTKVDADRIVDVLVNGIEGTPMTPGMKTEAEAQAIADYISTLK